MVKFEFVVSDVDAENILYAVRDSALRNDEMILENLTSKVTDALSYTNALLANKEYMLGLVDLMAKSTTRVPE
jgi:hypothetical protein